MRFRAEVTRCSNGSVELRATDPRALQRLQLGTVGWVTLEEGEPEAAKVSPEPEATPEPVEAKAPAPKAKRRKK